MPDITAVPAAENEKCATCVHNPQSSTFPDAAAFCETCVWAQRTLTDNYKSEDDYFEKGPQIRLLANNYPDNIYRSLFRIGNSDYNKRPKHLEENIEYVLELIRSKYDDTMVNILLLSYKEHLCIEQIARYLKRPQKYVYTLRRKSLQALVEFKPIIRYGADAPIKRRMQITFSDTNALEHQSVMSPEKQRSPFLLEQDISVLNLSMRPLKHLYAAGITTVEDLTKLSEAELLCISGIWKSCTDEIKTALAEYGLSLRN